MNYHPTIPKPKRKNKLTISNVNSNKLNCMHIYSTNSNWSDTSELANDSMFHAKKLKSGYSKMWLHSMIHLQWMYSILICNNFISIFIFFLYRLLFCIYINLYQITKSLHQFNTISISFLLDVIVEFSAIFCNILSNDNKEPAWTKDEI